MEERRKHERINKKFPIEILILNIKSYKKTEIIDISEGGFKLISNMPLDSAANASINVSDNNINSYAELISIKSNVKIAWTMVKDKDGYIYGFAFSGIEEGYKNIIKLIVKQEKERIASKNKILQKTEVNTLKKEKPFKKFLLILQRLLPNKIVFIFKKME